MKTHFPDYLYPDKSCEPIELDNCQMTTNILEEKCLTALTASSIDRRYISSIETTIHDSLSKRQSRYVGLENVTEIIEQLNRNLMGVRGIICTFSVDIESPNWDISVESRNPTAHLAQKSISLFGALMMAVKKFQGSAMYNRFVKKIRPTSEHECESFRLARVVSAVQDLDHSTLAMAVREAAVNHGTSF